MSMFTSHDEAVVKTRIGNAIASVLIKLGDELSREYMAEINIVDHGDGRLKLSLTPPDGEPVPFAVNVTVEE